MLFEAASVGCTRSSKRAVRVAAAQRDQLDRCSPTRCAYSMSRARDARGCPRGKYRRPRPACQNKSPPESPACKVASKAIHIGGRVGSRHSPNAGAWASTLAKVGALLRHLGEDEVGGAIENAHDLADFVARQALAQRLDQRECPPRPNPRTKRPHRRHRRRRGFRGRTWRSVLCWPSPRICRFAGRAKHKSRAGSTPPTSSATMSIASGSFKSRPSTSSETRAGV